jgi:hypothetical protein
MVSRIKWETIFVVAVFVGIVVGGVTILIESTLGASLPPI